MKLADGRLCMVGPRRWLRVVEGCEELQDLLAVFGELGFADAVDLRQLGQRRWPGHGDRAERRVLEDRIGGQALLPGRGAAPGAELLEDRGVRRGQVGRLDRRRASTAGPGGSRATPGARRLRRRDV